MAAALLARCPRLVSLAAWAHALVPGAAGFATLTSWALA